ncbi:unnamed protein product, partial [Polarella glacialis]
MAQHMKNSLFVRNLSPDVTESILREVFAQCDEIDKVSFKPYPNNASQFFAQIDFRTSAGVAEGSKLSDTKILGVACSCGVIDPIQQAEQGRSLVLAGIQGDDEESLAAQEREIQADHLRKAKEAAEEQRMRTVHVAGIAQDAKVENL